MLLPADRISWPKVYLRDWKTTLVKVSLSAARALRPQQQVDFYCTLPPNRIAGLQQVPFGIRFEGTKDTS
jgi:hypothetical protein